LPAPAKLLFRLQGVPDFDVERSDGWCEREIAGQVAMLDQFHDIGFVLDAVGRADRPAIELEGQQILDFDDLWQVGNFWRDRERNLAATPEHFATRQQIDIPVFSRNRYAAVSAIAASFAWPGSAYKLWQEGLTTKNAENAKKSLFGSNVIASIFLPLFRFLFDSQPFASIRV